MDNTVTDIIVIISSESNVTQFRLSKDTINKIEYFKFIEELKFIENTISIELDYNTYLTTVLDIIELLNIKSSNYLSIIREPIYYIKNKI